MSDITIITECVTVHADFLGKKSVQLPLVAVPDSKPGEQFFHCIPSNWRIHRLLVADRFVTVFGSRQKALSKTDILATLKTLKDEAWQRQVEESCGDAEVQRYTRGDKRAKVLRFETTVAIAAPSLADGEARVMLVVGLSKPSLGLVMLLTPGAIEYLRNAVSAQLEAGGSRSSDRRNARYELPDIDRVDTQAPNLSWSYEKNKFRATFFKEKEDGSTKRCQFLTESKDLAMTFVRTGNRPEKRTSLPAGLPGRHGRASSDDGDAASPEPSAAEDEDAVSCSDRDDQ